MEKTKGMTEAQKKADENWRKNNRDHANYLRARSTARSFVKNKSTLEDLEELATLMQERKSQLEQIK